MNLRLLKLLFVFPVAVLLLAGIQALNAEVPQPPEISAVAIYEANEATADDWPDHLVNYNITDPDSIDALFIGVEADTVRDCSGLDTDNDAYVYVKFNDSSRKVYHLFDYWHHFSLKGERDSSHWVDSDTRLMYMRNAQ